MFAIGSIWFFMWGISIGLVLLWCTIARAKVRRSLKKEGLWNISLDQFLTEAMPKLLPVDRAKAMFLYMHITKKTFAECKADIRRFEGDLNQKDQNAGHSREGLNCPPKIEPLVLHDERAYPWWISL